MSRAGSTLHVLTPTFRPAGGVVKIMDYVTHALATGHRVKIWCKEKWDPSLPLFGIDRFEEVRPDNPAVEFHSSPRLSIGPEDLVFVSLPSDFELAHRSLPRGFSPERIIHIIQGTRHATPAWNGGYALRLLTRPAARISVNEIVHSAIRPALDERAFHRVIPLGHDLEFFRFDRDGRTSRPLRVGFTTWKSDLGDRVAAGMTGEGFEFRAIRQAAGWAELSELYRWADVFLSTPGPEEGLYMPGLEAMAAGALVVTPDVGGNMAYCRPGENCLLVQHEDAVDYMSALSEIAAMPEARVADLRSKGYAVASGFSLADERRFFVDYLEELWPRIRAFEGRPV